MEKPGTNLEKYENKDVDKDVDKDKDKNEDKAIKSANSCCFLRAMGTLEKDELVRNPDYLSKDLTSLKFKLVYNIIPLNFFKSFVEKRFPTSYHHLIARTKHVDKIFLEEISNGVEQVVILGAGYDSRAYRFSDRLSGIRLFELDFPGTQALKKKRLKKLLNKIPENVVYVPIDFTTRTIEDVLKESDYDAKKRTFFIWEGVSMYLTETAIDLVLKFISENAASNSSIVWDYAYKSFIDGEYMPKGGPEAADHAKKNGEPYIFGVKRDEMAGFMKSRGFEMISHLSPKDLENLYLRRKDGKIDGNVHQYINVVYAKVRNEDEITSTNRHKDLELDLFDLKTQKQKE